MEADVLRQNSAWHQPTHLVARTRSSPPIDTGDLGGTLEAEETTPNEMTVYANVVDILGRPSAAFRPTVEMRHEVARPSTSCDPWRQESRLVALRP